MYDFQGQLNEVVNCFGIWLRILNHDTIAEALGCATSRIDKYGKYTKEELAEKLTIDEVVKLEQLVSSYGYEFTDAPNVSVKELINK